MNVVIVGAGYAGLLCALRLSRKARDAHITLINVRPEFVERVRLHEQAAGTPAQKLVLSQLLRGTGVRLELGAVSAIDLAQRSVRVGERTLSWDRLVLALGSHDDVDRVEGAREHAFTLSAAHAPGLAERAKQGGALVVIGGGLTGIEAACELAESHPGLQVSLVTRGALAPDVSAGARQHVHDVLARLGVRVHEHTAVQRIETDRVVAQDRALPFATCIWAAGFAAPTLLREAGLEVDASGRAWVDEQLRALGHPDVCVIGDAGRLTGAGANLPMGCKMAMPMGQFVADHLSGPETPFRFRPPLYCVSLGRREALIQTLPADAPRARFYRGGLAVRIKEWICRGTVLFLRWEHLRASFTALITGRRALALAADNPSDTVHV